MDNQKDIISNRQTSQNDNGFSSRTVFKESSNDRPFSDLSVTSKSIANLKIDKIITALFLVTDIMDKNEPLRIRLRDVGLSVLPARNISRSEVDGSDTTSFMSDILEIVSLINIAKSVRLISDMNSSILVRELNLIIISLENKIEMKNSIESIFFGEEKITPSLILPNTKEEVMRPARIGEIGGVNSKKIDSNINTNSNTKNARKELIIKLIKDKGDANPTFSGVTTKDIAIALRLLGDDKGEKTIQRELISLLEQGLIKKTGEKRWSRYSLI